MLLWLGGAATGFCQTDSTIIYLNTDFDQVSKEEAAYYRVVRITDPGTGRGYRKDFFITGEKFEEVNFSKTDSVRDGLSQTWFKNGQLKEKKQYVKGKLEGKSAVWFEDGKKKWEMTYRNGELHDTLKTYHANQQLKRLDVYANGKLLRGQCFNEAGTLVPHYPFEVMPEFPGGQRAMFQFLANNMEIPKDMRKGRQNGHVVLSFMVGADGEPGNIKVVKTTHASLAANAIQVIQAMPRWRPGIQDGEKVPVRYTVPYNIKVN